MKTQLNSHDFIAALNKHLSDDKPDQLMQLLGHIVKDSIGMSLFAKATGLDRTQSYKLLSKKGNPQLDTLVKTLDLMGLQIQIQPKE